MLGGYDGEDHAAKLIPCSHTVCVSCLKVCPSGSVCCFKSFFAEDRGYGCPTARVQAIPISVFRLVMIFYIFRCPICRELIRIPPGGVMAFPPSFLVNQLRDLMARQIREFVPNCSQHENQVNPDNKNHHSYYYYSTHSLLNLSLKIRCLLDDIPLDNEDKEKSHYSLHFLTFRQHQKKYHYYYYYSQELMFCETCDLTFCLICVGGEFTTTNNCLPGPKH